MSRPIALASCAALVLSAAGPARAGAILAPLVASALGGGAQPGPGGAAKAPGHGKPVDVPGLGDIAGAAAKTDLPQLLQLAVRQSPALASATIDVEIALAQVESSLALDDWTVQAKAQGQSTKSSFLGSGFNKQASATVDVLRTLSTGTQFDLHGELDWSHTSSKGILGSSSDYDSVQATEFASLGVTQPLLRGRGSKVARALQVENALLADAAALTRRQNAINIVENVVTAYWDLVAAQRNLEIAQGSLQLAQERLRVTQIGVNGGKIADSELLAVEEAIATRQEDVLNAEVGVLQQSLLLRRTVGMEIGPGQIALDAGAELTVPSRAWSLPDLLTQAEHASPQLAALAKQEENATVQVEVTENGLLPQLDLSIALGPVGSVTLTNCDMVKNPMSDCSSPLSQAFDQLTQHPGLFAAGSLTFSQSIGRHQIYGTQRAQRAQREKIRIGAADVRLQIAQAMAQTVALVRAAEQRVALGGRAIELAQKNILVEQSRFELGKSTNFDVLLRQDELRQAQLREARAQVDWHKAQGVIAALTGTLLVDYGIDLK
jgi:outer membrane protein